MDDKTPNQNLEPIAGQPGWYWDHKTGRTVSEEELGGHLEEGLELDDDADDEYQPFDDEGEEYFGEDLETQDPSSSSSPNRRSKETEADTEAPRDNPAGGQQTPENVPGTDGAPSSKNPTDILNALPTDKMGETGEKIEKAKDLARDVEDLGKLLATEGADLEAWGDLALRHKDEIKKGIQMQVIGWLIAIFIVFGVPVVIVSLAFMGYGTETASGLTSMPPGVPQPANVQEYCKYVGSITNTEAKSIYGSTESEVAAQLVSIDFPQVGSVRVHRLAAPCFVAAGQEMVRNGALNNYRINSFGTFNWRCAKNTDYTCKSTLSNHSFGIAVDINPGTNPYKSNQLITDLPPGLISAFKLYGFGWGGDWRSSKDAMHFEWLGRPSQN